MPDYRSLPSVTELASIRHLQRFHPKLRIEAARQGIENAREELAKGNKVDTESLALVAAIKLSHGSIRRIYNFTGVILHTGLGRAPLDKAFSIGYSNLEIDLETGKRGDRQNHVRSLLCELTGAEDALVVNNGAAGLLLSLTALCAKKEVLLSRGQSVEIGGAFRMPDVIKASGCKLVDVGTTNKTSVQDYVGAITSRTKAILQCHPSNFVISGFASSASTTELSKAAHENGVLFINDQGNGALVDFAKYGLKDIETLSQSVASGADITIGSGDKLLGGPQCGIILGRKELIRKLSKHPLARALRIDKSNLMFLNNTLRNYSFNMLEEIPLFRCLEHSPETIRTWCEMICPDGADILETTTEIGSGAAPGQGVKSFAIVLKSRNPEKLAASLRTSGYVGRIHRGMVWLDPRTADDIFEPSVGAKDEFVNHFCEITKNILTTYWEKWK